MVGLDTRPGIPAEIELPPGGLFIFTQGIENGITGNLVDGEGLTPIF